MNTLENLDVWKKSRALRIWIANLVKQFPNDEKFRLTDQMIRASRSIAVNIAEGHGRYHFQENIQFCHQSRGSLVELFEHMTCALDERYIQEAEYDEFLSNYEQLFKMLNGYISYLKRRKQES